MDSCINVSMTTGEVFRSRPPWMPPDRTPRDVDMTAKALIADFNPNDPEIHDSLLTHHNKFGIVKTGLVRRSAPAGLKEFGLQQSGRHTQHHIIEVNSRNQCHIIEVNSHIQLHIIEVNSYIL